MGAIPSGEVFGCDWYSRTAVVQLAIKLGPGMLVYRHPARMNYNITHAEREKDLPIGAEIIFKTKEKRNGR